MPYPTLSYPVCVCSYECEIFLLVGKKGDIITSLGAGKEFLVFEIFYLFFCSYIYSFFAGVFGLFFIYI